jgi:hypothetical protein
MDAHKKNGCGHDYPQPPAEKILEKMIPEAKLI